MLITIPGKPIPKKSPHFARCGKFVRTYSSQTKEVEVTRLIIREQWKYQPIEGAVSLKWAFFMPIPKSTSKVKREAMLSGEIPHIKKPDLDNMIKFYKDCMNGIVWKDDSQVNKYRDAYKAYDENPRVEIDIKRALIPKKQGTLL